MIIKVPRKAGTEWFAIRQGDFRSWSGWIIEELLGPNNDYDNYSFGGTCLFCPGDFGADLMCQGSYSGYRDGTGRRILHCGVNVGESESGDLLAEEDTWTAIITADNYDWRYRDASESAYCRPCEGGDYDDYELNRIEDIYSHAGATGQEFSVEMVYQEGRTKKWFRDFWNSLVTEEYQVEADEACPIEPGWDRFLAFYGTLYEMESSASHGNSGWCHPFGTDGTPCSEQSSCYTYPGGVGSQIVLASYYDFVGPSISYPIEFKRNAAHADYWPSPPGEGHIDHWDVNEM